MIIKRPDSIKASEITDETNYQNRREFLSTVSRSTLALAAGASFPVLLGSRRTDAAPALGNIQKSRYALDEEKTPIEDITRYNNFYEFSTDKEGPALLARKFKTDPWTLRIEGEVNKPATYQLEDFIKPYTLEERVYRLRCVEAWSMVIPWVGFAFADVLKKVEPTSRAKFVEFTTLYDPRQMPGQQRRVLEWPYVEGLRIDEAAHPLTILAVGLYGKLLPNQNGAPLRLVVPWKYGFKNIKSIVRIRFTEKQPGTTWNIAGPQEYGFYANVNPTVDHPRWSQARERRIGDFFKRETLMFNGYADEVAGLYSGMDLRKYY
ncbi:MAG: protein-methionine-sulfoxide reductase catalytic subunit MsrP [Gammaproteobacteria bacterium]|nr:protein-methionine-sulfoxide reductase catalytic subunit MsrP [Gammaproteobacteria bacterium]